MKRKRFSLFLGIILWIPLSMVSLVTDDYKLIIQKGNALIYSSPVINVDSLTYTNIGSKKLLKVFSRNGALTKVSYSEYVTTSDSMLFAADSASILQYAYLRTSNDWAPAFEKALAMHDIVYVPEGTYECSQVNVPSGKKIQGSGSKSIFVPLTASLFRIDGQKASGVAVTEDVAEFSNKIVVGNTEGLSKGDDILIQSQRNCMLKEGIEGKNYILNWVLGRSRKVTVFYGEFNKVKRITNNTITTENNLIYPCYYKDDSREPELPSEGYVTKKYSTVHKMTFAKHAALSNFTIQGTAAGYKPIIVKYADSCLVENISYKSDVESFNDTGASHLTIVRILNSKNTEVRNCHSILSQSVIDILKTKNKNWDNYSIYNIFKVESSMNCGFQDCSANGATNAFHILKSNSLASFCTTNCYIRNCKASNNIWAGALVTQGCYDNEVSNCTITESAQGISIFSRCNKIFNNHVSTTLPLTTNYTYTHIDYTSNNKKVYLGGTQGILLAEGYSCGQPNKRTIVSENVIEGFYTGISVRDGYEDKNIFEMGFIDVNNNHVERCFNGFGVYRNGFNTSPAYLDIHVFKNTFKRASAIELPTENHTPTPVYICEGVSGITEENNTTEGF